MQLRARLNGWVPREDNQPGKFVLTRGLRRLLDLVVAQAFLERIRSDHSDLPPRIAALLHSPPSEDSWLSVRCLTHVGFTRLTGRAF